MTVRITFLGTADAFCAGGRSQSSYLIRTPRTCILLDCGATILVSLNRLGLRASDIDFVVISHLHGDHAGGLPFLFLHYSHIEPRRRPLTIFGPKGVEERAAGMFAALYRNAASAPLPFETAYAEMLPGRAFDAGDVGIEPFQVPHENREVSLALRLRAAGKTILYSGDTGWSEDLVSHAQGTDLFICECSFLTTRLESHLDYPRLLENRERFGTRRLILTHLGSEMLRLRGQAEIETADDGMSVEV